MSSDVIIFVKGKHHVKKCLFCFISSIHYYITEMFFTLQSHGSHVLGLRHYQFISFYFNKQTRFQGLLFLFSGNCFDNKIRVVKYGATSTDPGHSPSDAVLDNERAWCTSQPPPNEYLEVFLGHLYDVCGIVIQGFKNESVNFFTTNYSLSFSKGKPAWSFLLNNDNSPKVNTPY